MKISNKTLQLACCIGLAYSAQTFGHQAFAAMGDSYEKKEVHKIEKSCEKGDKKCLAEKSERKSKETNKSSKDKSSGDGAGNSGSYGGTGADDSYGNPSGGAPDTSAPKSGKY